MTALRLLLTADAVGGVWQYSMELARGLVPHGYEITLALLGPAPGAGQRAEAGALDGLRLVELAGPLDWLARDAASVRQAEAALAALAAEVGADIVQLHSPALASQARYPCPVLAVCHSCVATWWAAVRGGPMPADLAWRAALVAEGLRKAGLVIVPTAAFGEALRRQYGSIPALAVVPNGRALLVRPADMRHRVFTAGRLWDAGKDVRTLDRAAARLDIPFAAAGPVIGPNGETIGLRNLRHLGILDPDQIARELAGRPIFASAARYEPFGLAVLEAAAAGCALVLSDIPGFRELWSGVATFVPAGNPDAFARAIKDLVANPGARIAAGERAQERAAHFTPALMAAQMASFHAGLVKRAAA